MRTIKETLTYNLVMLRKGMSMASLAEAAGVPYRTYQDIEGGGNWPRVDTLEAIAKALGVPVTRLFQDPAQKPSPSEVLSIVAEALQAMGKTQQPPPQLEPLPDDEDTRDLLALLRQNPDISGVLASTARAMVSAGNQDQASRRKS